MAMPPNFRDTKLNNPWFERKNLDRSTIHASRSIDTSMFLVVCNFQLKITVRHGRPGIEARSTDPRIGERIDQSGGRVFTEPRAGNLGAQPRLKSRGASRRSTMVVESSFATRLPVADGFKAIGRGGGEGRLGGQRGWGGRHNGKAANKAYPRVIRNSHRPVPARS